MKILYIPDRNFTITQLKQRLGEFTLHQGEWPNLIFMEPEGILHYTYLLGEEFPPEKLTFMGIRIAVLGGDDYEEES